MSKKSLGIILAVSILSLGGIIRTFAYEVLRIPFPLAQALDQFLPIFLIMAYGLFAWQSNKFKIPKIKFSWLDVMSLLILAATAALAHRGLLTHFFFKEDVINLLTLSEVAQGASGQDINNFFLWAVYYPFTVFFSLYFMVGTSALAYMVLSLAATFFAAALSYLIAHTILQSRTLALVAAALFVSAPIYLEVFIWKLTATGFSIALVVFLAGIFIFLQSRERPSAPAHILSLLATVAVLKIGFVRSVIYPPILLVLDILKQKKISVTNLKKSLVEAWPHWVILFVAVLAAGFTYVSTYSNQTGFSHWDRFLRSFVLLIDQSIPFPAAQWFFKTFLVEYAGEKSLILAAVVAGIGIVISIALYFLGSPLMKRAAAAGWLWYFSAVIFEAFFGDNAGRGSLDQTFLNYGYMPGSKFLHFAAPGLAIALTATAAGILKRVTAKYSQLIVSVVAIPIVVIMAIQTNEFHRVFNEEQSIPAKNLLTKIFPTMLPNDRGQLLLYSKTKSPIDGFTGGGDNLPAFGLPVVENTHDFDFVVDELKKNHYQLDQLFAFEYTIDPFQFSETTDEVRTRVKDSLEQ